MLDPQLRLKTKQNKTKQNKTTTNNKQQTTNNKQQRQQQQQQQQKKKKKKKNQASLSEIENHKLNAKLYKYDPISIKYMTEQHKV